MPQIIVTADGPAEDGKPPIMFRERVSVSDFESQHFTMQLAERLGWAVGDADEVERRSARTAERRRSEQHAAEAETAEDQAAELELAEAQDKAEVTEPELAEAEPEADGEPAEPEFAGVSAGPARPAS
jgi:hypothetical protein